MVHSDLPRQHSLGTTLRFTGPVRVDPRQFIVVVVVVDSHVQRIILATEETTVTQQVSHRPIKCQSRLLWSQRETKVNGSHHGDNPLLRPTGIQIATKSYSTLQAMAPTNSKRFIKPPYSYYREQPRSTRIAVQVSQGHTL